LYADAFDGDPAARIRWRVQGDFARKPPAVYDGNKALTEQYFAGRARELRPRLRALLSTRPARSGSPLGELMESWRRCAGSETADRVARADEPMGRGGPEPRRQLWYPRLQYRLPGRLHQLAVEEGDPIGAAASVAQGLVPAPRRDRVTGLRAVLEATLIPFNPWENCVGTTQGKEGLGDHGTVVGVTTDQIRAGAVQEFQCFLDSSTHGTFSVFPAHQS